MPAITIDGRGDTVRDAARDMWKRMQSLQEKGFQPISSVEIVDTSSNKIILTYQLTDPEFEVHLKSDAREQGTKSTHQDEHHPPTAHEYAYIARISLEG